MCVCLLNIRALILMVIDIVPYSYLPTYLEETFVFCKDYQRSHDLVILENSKVFLYSLGALFFDPVNNGSI